MDKESGASIGSKVSEGVTKGFQQVGATVNNQVSLTTSTDSLRGCQQAHVSNMHGLINAPVSSASLSDTSPSFNSTMGFWTSFSSPFLPSSSWEVPVEDCSAQAVVLEEGYVPSIHCETTCTGSLPSDLDFRESEGQSGMTKNAGPNACLRSFRSKQLNQSFQQSTDQNNLEDLLNYKSTTRMTDTMHSKKDELGNGDRACTIGPSLRCVLSDPITGSLLDDAMVSICGHSFGGAGLRRVIETGTCISCGASISSGSLFPNHALREAVDAYKREECYRHMTSKDLKRRRENSEVLEDVEGKKMNMVWTWSLFSRLVLGGKKISFYETELQISLFKCILVMCWEAPKSMNRLEVNSCACVVDAKKYCCCPC